MSRRHRRLDRRRWAALRRFVFRRDEYRCRRCGRAGRLEADHIQPLHRGGAAYDPLNVQALCRHCHLQKTAAENRRPDPARDRWQALVRDLQDRC